MELVVATESYFKLFEALLSGSRPVANYFCEGGPIDLSLRYSEVSVPISYDSEIKSGPSWNEVTKTYLETLVREKQTLLAVNPFRNLVLAPYMHEDSSWKLILSNRAEIEELGVIAFVFAAALHREPSVPMFIQEEEEEEKEEKKTEQKIVVEGEKPGNVALVSEEKEGESKSGGEEKTKKKEVPVRQDLVYFANRANPFETTSMEFGACDLALNSLAEFWDLYIFARQNWGDYLPGTLRPAENLLINLLDSLEEQLAKLLSIGAESIHRNSPNLQAKRDSVQELRGTILLLENSLLLFRNLESLTTGQPAMFSTRWVSGSSLRFTAFFRGQQALSVLQADKFFVVAAQQVFERNLGQLLFLQATYSHADVLETPFVRLSNDVPESAVSVANAHSLLAFDFAFLTRFAQTMDPMNAKDILLLLAEFLGSTEALAKLTGKRNNYWLAQAGRGALTTAELDFLETATSSQYSRWRARIRQSTQLPQFPRCHLRPAGLPNFGKNCYA